MNEKQIIESLEEMLSDYYVRIEYLDAIYSACEYIKKQIEPKKPSSMKNPRGFCDGITNDDYINKCKRKGRRI